MRCQTCRCGSAFRRKSRFPLFREGAVSTIRTSSARTKTVCPVPSLGSVSVAPLQIKRCAIRLAAEGPSRCQQIPQQRDVGLRYKSSGVPLCTTRPCDMTATRSAIAIASSWSWVTKIAVISNSRNSMANSSRKVSRKDASSAESGSSNKSNLGRGAMARARRRAVFGHQTAR